MQFKPAVQSYLLDSSSLFGKLLYTEVYTGWTYISFFFRQPSLLRGHWFLNEKKKKEKEKNKERNILFLPHGAFKQVLFMSIGY